MKFTLPMPPSINRTYGVNRAADKPFYKKELARDWEVIAGWELKRQWKGPKQPFKGRVKVAVDWFYKYDRDIEAGLKILFDLLQKQRVLKNDKQIRYVTHIGIVEDKKNPRVEIEVDEIF